MIKTRLFKWQENTAVFGSLDFFKFYTIFESIETEKKWNINRIQKPEMKSDLYSWRLNFWGMEFFFFFFFKFVGRKD